MSQSPQTNTPTRGTPAPTGTADSALAAPAVEAEIASAAGAPADTVRPDVAPAPDAPPGTPPDTSCGLTPRVVMDRVNIHFPMHLDGGRGGGVRKQILRALAGRGMDRRYHTGLHRVSITAEVGDRIGIVGRNGSGKTTLLRTLAGIYEPDSGSILRVGKTVSLINLSMGMDVYGSGRENIYRRVSLFGIRGSEADAIVRDVEAFSELGSFLDEPIRTYSSGMMARLSFGIATSIQAQVILMDEWISAGDKRFIEAAEARMNDYFQGERIIFLASHSAALVRQWCNRLIVMDKGRVIDDTRDVNTGIAEFHKLLAEDDGSR